MSARRVRLRTIAAAVLATPVIAWIYALSLARGKAARPTLVGGLVLVSSLAAVSVPETRAIPPSRSADIAAAEFRPVDLSIVGLEGAGRGPSTAFDPIVSDVLDLRVLTTGGPAAVAPVAPRVVRFRPRDGWTGVSRVAALSVRFTQPMDRPSTVRSFHADIDGRAIAGRPYWAEGDQVLVIVPSRPLPFGVRVRLAVTGSARSAQGVPIGADHRASFRVEARPQRPPAAREPERTATGWRWPLIGPITQRFGESLTQYGVHQGIDINGETGDPVRAARRGRVIVAGHYDACGGLDVHIDHGDGFVSWYRHLSRVEVPVGRWVEAGTLIGRVGNTGCSLGSHLHFGIQRRGTFVDPERYLPRRG